MVLVPKMPAGKPAVATTAGNGNKPPQTLAVSSGLQVTAQKVVLYGPGGVGKSKLASLLNMVGVRPLFIDLEAGTKFLDVARLEPETWEEMRHCLHDFPMWDNYDAAVIDTGTKAEEMGTAWTFANVPKIGERDGGVTYVTSVEGYGWGKGYVHVAETYLQLLGDLDALARRGKHIVLICHDCTANVPNPEGIDWIRWEPRLQSPPSGKASIRHRVKEWADHLLFVGYDTFVAKDGKASGSGSRTIYTSERPTLWAKSRLLSDPIAYIDNDPTLWKLLLGKE